MSKFFDFRRSRKSSMKALPAQHSMPTARKTSNLSGIYQPKAEEMKQVFEKIDKNRDGKISLEEYKLASKMLGKGIADSEVVKAFKATDSDGDGFIDFKEFMATLNNNGGVDKSDIESAFHAFDIDGDGKIKAEELKEFLSRIGECCSLEACRKMVKGVDTDGDGFIDKDEFMQMMTSTMKPC